MKKHFQLIAFITLYCCNSCFAQTSEKKTVKAGESLSSISYYLFPGFSDAIVKLKDGNTLKSKMNFNLTICQLEFISPQGDTLVIAEPSAVDSIYCNNEVFFFANNIYYQVIASAGAIKLAVERTASYVPVKIGALGLPDHVGSGIETYKSFFLYTGLKTLVASEDVEITVRTTYVLVTGNTQFNRANKNSFIKAFPANEQKIKTYLKQNRVSFDKAGDLEKFFLFCAA
ncbi:hypothetical protein [Parafilimonas terrae]|uniref:LysM domain-containing protein n=1 Tax=Parafilimonas terrae TaxID=1465490 RepID=A0A1I5S9W5_9BACT|nr:hypothetical protein [Parafilimonas terrae]SFP67588.1 hypothetical protein SAMN05444277_101663 [Parafilimonas terrae]